MASPLARSGKSIYDAGIPLPGKETRNDPGTVKKAAFTTTVIPFGRILAPFILQSSNNKLVAELGTSDTLSDGISVYSFDAIDAQENLSYSPDEAVTVMSKGTIIVEAAEDLALDNTPLTVINATGSAPDIGKVSQTTGSGFSTTTNLRLVKKYSATLVEIEITGPIALAAG